MYIFETMRLDEGFIPRLKYHEARIRQSAKQLDYQYNQETFERYLQNIRLKHPKGIFRLKVMLDKEGVLSHQVAELPDKQHFSARAQAIDTHYPKWQYINKTSNRKHVEHNHETDVVLYYDHKGKVLEFDIGNILIKEDYHYYTPIWNEDFLKGCMRQQLLDEGQIEEKSYQIDELKEKLKAEQIQIFLINSLREVADIDLKL